MRLHVVLTPVVLTKPGLFLRGTTQQEGRPFFRQPTHSRRRSRRPAASYKLNLIRKKKSPAGRFLLIRKKKKPMAGRFSLIRKKQPPAGPFLLNRKKKPPAGRFLLFSPKADKLDI